MKKTLGIIAALLLVVGIGFGSAQLADPPVGGMSPKGSELADPPVGGMSIKPGEDL